MNNLKYYYSCINYSCLLTSYCRQTRATFPTILRQDDGKFVLDRSSCPVPGRVGRGLSARRETGESHAESSPGRLGFAVLQCSYFQANF